ncbi:MAG: MarC family protein [Alphaproteobacteria bacterium]|nr:MarC family protein [Alphaproteobacteria bacterium]
MAEIAVQAFTILFVTIGPLDVAPIFLGLVGEASAQLRRRLALKACLVAAIVLYGFAFFGEALMTALGIGFPALRLAGGILLLLVAIDLVLARPSGLSSITAEERSEAERELRHHTDISVFPLAIPLIAGPGAMTAVVLLMAQHEGERIAQGIVLATLALVIVLALLALLFADVIRRLLGRTGVNVVTRVGGILLAALAAQFIIDGLRSSRLFG